MIYDSNNNLIGGGITYGCSGLPDADISINLELLLLIQKRMIVQAPEVVAVARIELMVTTIETEELVALMVKVDTL